MRYVIFSSLVAILVAASACSSSRSLSADSVIKNSVWVNLTPSQMKGENGTVIKSIYFADDNQVFMKTGVGQDSTIIAAPVFSGCGTYTCSGTLKKGIMVSINTDYSTIGRKVNMEGIITSEGMMLIEPDSAESFYFRLQTSNK